MPSNPALIPLHDLNLTSNKRPQMVIPEKNPAGRTTCEVPPRERNMSQFRLREGRRPIRHLDTSDMKQIVDGATMEMEKKTGRKKEGKTQTLALPASSNLPPHLLMASLLEQLCILMEPNKDKAEKLFKVLCGHLSKLNIIAPLSQLDEMKSLRLQHRTNLTRIMRSAMFHLNQNSQSMLALPSCNPSIRLDKSVLETDIINEETSRYRTEFEELGRLGKGGFGSVYKARNYLDGTCYAVKKIRFKQKNSELLMKLLREVKALAFLQHANIVGYNVAWMEYDNSFAYSMTSSSNESPHTEDSQSVTESMRDETQNNSLSIEFLDSDDDDKEESGGAPNNFPAFGARSMAMAARNFSSTQRVKIEEITSLESNMTNSRVSSSQEHTDIELNVNNIECSNKSNFVLPKKKTVPYTSQETGEIGHNAEVIAKSRNDKSHVKYSASTTRTTTYEEQRLSESSSHAAQMSSSFYSSIRSEIQVTEEKVDMSALDTCPLPLEIRNVGEMRDVQCISANCSKGNVVDSASSVGFSPLVCQAADLDSNSNHPSKGLSSPEKSSKLTSSIHSILKPTDHISHKGSVKKTASHSGRQASVKIVPLEEDSQSDIDCRIEPRQETSANMGRVLRRRRPSFRRCFSMDAATDFGGVTESKNHDYDVQNSITLYIQMELCTLTLAEWLLERNDTLDAHTDYKDCLCTQNMHIFSQVLEGVDYIHSKGLIHRDLKPRNIFLSGPELNVKIGDFGLAKEGVISPEGDEQISHILRACSYSSTSTDHTSGVGTSAYAAPEQLEGSVYDAKSDMYSLGVILYEMFQIFNTGMERADHIQNLRKGICCPNFQKYWPQQANAVATMTLKIPSERPSAKDLLMSGLFLSAEQQVKIFKQIVKEKDQALQEKDKTIAAQRKELTEKDKIISDLKQQLDRLLTSSI